MKRQTINAFSIVKTQFVDLKNYLSMNESETLAYLLEFHNKFSPNLKKLEHDEILERVKDLHNQYVI